MANIHRRFLLAALGGLVLTPTAFAQSIADEEVPLIIRDRIEGVDPRYARYATQGPYVFSSSPATVKGKGFDYYVFFPRRLKTPRLIVFSHGALADPLAYRDLLWHWVSHGFVVVAPLHRDSIIERGPTLRKTTVNSVSDWPIAALLEDPVAWQERAEACVSVLDDIDTLSRAIDADINIERPIIVGHGYGAYVAQMLLGAVAKDGDGRERTFHDPRFFAGIMMSPQGPGVMGFTNDSWSKITAPSLFLIAENEADFTGQPAVEKAKSYLLSKAGYKHIGFLKGASTNAFSGQNAKTNTSEGKIFEAIRAITTGFLLAYGQYEKEAFNDMTTDFFERMSLGVVDEGRR